MGKDMVLMPYRGERYFWQWDSGRKLIVSDEACCEVHFCNKTEDCALVCEVYELNGLRVVDVPNILLQTAKPITAYVYVIANDGRITTSSVLLKVVARNKPDTYVYTETETKSWEDSFAQIKENEKQMAELTKAVNEARAEILAAIDRVETLPKDAEQLVMLAEVDMLPAVHENGAILTDENGNVILRY